MNNRRFCFRYWRVFREKIKGGNSSSTEQKLTFFSTKVVNGSEQISSNLGESETTFNKICCFGRIKDSNFSSTELKLTALCR